MRVGSLFSGYGGLDLAVSAFFHAQVAWYSEIEPSACKVMMAHNPGVPNLGHITKVDWAEIQPVDVITGGYPCQPFSMAGQRKGTKDERHLWPYVRDAISAIRPRIVVLENVRGHLTLGLDVVLADLAGLGMSARWGVVRASDAGAPHRRERVFIVATDSERPGLQGQPERSMEWASEPAASGNGSISWDKYEAAIKRWEDHLGRSAPDPTVLGRNNRPRLSPRFVEWMMGIPDGWVTGHGLSRSQELKMLGNGVVPQQANLALSLLHTT